MKTIHTPAPWTVQTPGPSQDGYPHNLSICHESEMRAVYIASIPGGRHYKRAQADAALIAAAPDLLAALETIANQCGPFTVHGLPPLDYATIGNIARAALAEATAGEVTDKKGAKDANL